MLTDPFGRAIDYVRLSVTDRCDLRCTYCMPEDFKGFEEPEHWLSFDENERLVGAFARLGVKRVHLTGGEPLLRRNLTDLATRLSALPGVEDLPLSTNATQLSKHAQALKDAGVSRLQCQPRFPAARAGGKNQRPRRVRPDHGRPQGRARCRLRQDQAQHGGLGRRQRKGGY